MRDGADGVAGRLQLEQQRVVSGQVEGTVQGALGVREGRSERSAETHPAGEQREQAGDELEGHAGGAAREGVAGAEDHALVQAFDVDIRRFRSLREEAGGGGQPQAATGECCEEQWGA